MRRYYAFYPRDFANEYTVYAVESDLVARFEAAFPDARRVTRKDAIRLGVTRPAEAKRCGEQWFGGFEVGVASCRLPYNATLAQVIDALADDTRAAVEEAEARADAARAYREEMAQLCD